MQKNSKAILFTILPIALFILFIIFLFSLPSTYGIFKWNEYYKNLLVKISFLPILISLLGFFSILLKKVKVLNKILSILNIALNFVLIIILVGAVVFIYINSNPSFTSTPPIFMLSDSTGAYGLPDVQISFKTEKNEIIQCEYYDETQIENKMILKDSITANTHKFIIKDLKPESTYYFNLSNGKSFKYKTAKAKIDVNSPFSFAISSDAHFGRDKSRNDITEKIVKLIENNPDYSFFAILGDFVESGYVKSHWQILLDFIGKNFENLPILPVMGNHDAFIGGHRFYKSIFSSINTENTTSPYYKHYSFKIDNKNIHIITLSLLWGIEDFSIKQRNWLIKKLSKTNKDDFVIILSHAFLYASGYTEEGGIPWFDNKSAIKTLEPIFKKYDVDLVVSGHNHTMELIENDSIYYAIIGSFGGLPDPEKTFTSKGSLWYKSGLYGYLEVKSFADFFTLTFYDENKNILFQNRCNY
jgi:predicted MPP superfamily phosphohydrolase